MPQLNDFYNEGFGWICRHCERELEREQKPDQRHTNTDSEDETESKEAELANHTFAKWTDKTRRFLTCPRCGITEAAELS